MDTKPVKEVIKIWEAIASVIMAFLMTVAFEISYGWIIVLAGLIIGIVYVMKVGLIKEKTSGWKKWQRWLFYGVSVYIGVMIVCQVAIGLARWAVRPSYEKQTAYDLSPEGRARDLMRGPVAPLPYKERKQVEDYRKWRQQQ